MSTSFNLLPKCKDCYKHYSKHPNHECKKCINGSRFVGRCKSCMFTKGEKHIEDVFLYNPLCTYCLKTEYIFTLDVYSAVV